MDTAESLMGWPVNIEEIIVNMTGDIALTVKVRLGFGRKTFYLILN